MRSSKKVFVVCMMLVISLLAAACESAVPVTDPPPTATNTMVPVVPTATQTPEPTPTVTPTETIVATATPTLTPTPFVSGPFDFPEFINPLTGLTISDLSLLERNPVMIKVSNFPRGLRPHTGLTWADLVFEYYIGAGATRFSAIYYGQNAPEVGPIRSARLIDAQLGNLYQTVFAFASADARVYRRVLNSLGDRAISEGPSTCPAICRNGGQDVNSVRAQPALVTEYAAEKGVLQQRPDLTGTKFDSMAPEGGRSGTKVSILYSFATISEWRYDAASNLYLRYIEEVNADGEVKVIPLLDALTDTQLSASNVVVLFVETIEITPTLHDFSLANNFYGQRALLFRDGQVYELVWKSQGADKPLQLYDQNDELVPLKPGNTWFHVVGLYSSQEETASGEWELYNYLP